MQLYVIDERKRAQYRFKENEGLQFSFDVEVDKAEEIVHQMVEQQLIPDSDIKHITKLIKDKVSFHFHNIFLNGKGYDSHVKGTKVRTISGNLYFFSFK